MNELSEKIDKKKRSLYRYLNLKYKSINENKRNYYKQKIKQAETEISNLRKQVLNLI